MTEDSTANTHEHFDEQTLLTRIGAGDEEALKQLYASYRPRLWRYVWQQVDGDAGIAEEVLQDVFLAIWQNAKAFRAQASIATWIFRIAHNIAFNANRAARHHQRHTAEVSLIDRSAFPEQETVERILLAEAIQQLSMKHRQALELVFYHGFTCEEAGQILGVPTGTVKSRLSYARQQLSTCLAETTTTHNSANTPRPSQSLGMGETHHDA